MTDISKCDGKGCPRKDTCYRYTAPANPYRQSYLGNPLNPADLTCDVYWPVAGWDSTDEEDNEEEE